MVEMASQTSLRRRPAAPALGLAAALALCTILFTPPEVSRAYNEDLTNTQWRLVGGWIPLEILFLEGKPGKPVKVAWISPDGEKTLKYEGTYDGRNLVLNALDVNAFLGQTRTVVATISADGRRISGTEREYVPDRMDETEPVEFERVGGPPPRGDEPEAPGGPGGPGDPGVTSRPPWKPFSGGEGPVPLGLAVGGGVVGLLIGLGLGAVANSLTGAPVVRPQAAAMPPAGAPGGHQQPRPVPPAGPPDSPPGGAVVDGDDLPPVGAPTAPLPDPAAPPPESYAPAQSPSPGQEQTPRNRVVRVELMGREVRAGTNRFELTAKVTVAIAESMGDVRLMWPDGLLSTEAALPPGGTKVFRREFEAEPGSTLSVQGWVDNQDPRLPATWIAGGAVAAPQSGAGAVPAGAGAHPPGTGQEPKRKNRITDLELEGYQFFPGPDKYQLIARVTVDVAEQSGLARCKWSDGEIETKPVLFPGGIAIFKRIVTAGPNETITVQGWVDHADPRLRASWKVRPAPDSQIVVTVTKQGFASGRIEERVQAGCARAAGRVSSRYQYGGKLENLPVADARWEAAGRSDGMVDFKYLGDGRTGTQGEFTVSLDEILLTVYKGQGSQNLSPLELQLDDTTRRDLKGYDDQVRRLPGGAGLMRPRALCERYPLDFFRQLCTLQEAEHAKLSAALNLLRFAVAYVVMYRFKFEGHRVRVATVVRDTFGSFVDFVIEWTEIASWLWGWFSISPKAMNDAVLKFWSTRGGRKLPLAETFARWMAKMAEWGAKIIDWVFSFAGKAMGSFVDLIVRKGATVGWREPGKLMALVRSVGERTQRIRAASARAMGNLPPASNEPLILLFQKVMNTHIASVLTIVVFMLWLTACLCLGSVAMLIITLFWAISLTKRQMKGTQAWVIEAMENQLGDLANSLYAAVGDCAEKIPDFWVTSAAVIGLDEVVDNCMPPVEKYDQLVAPSLEKAYHDSLGRRVPEDWTESARRMRDAEQQDARTFMKEQATQEWIEWASRSLKFATKVAQGVLWGISSILQRRVRNFMVGVLLAGGLTALPRNPSTRRAVAQASRYKKISESTLDWGGFIERWVNFADFALIWMPLLYREIWWLLYTEGAAMARLRGLYEGKSR